MMLDVLCDYFTIANEEGRIIADKWLERVHEVDLKGLIYVVNEELNPWAI